MARKFNLIDGVMQIAALWVVTMFDPMAALSLVMADVLIFVGRRCEREYQGFCAAMAGIFVVMALALAISKII